MKVALLVPLPPPTGGIGTWALRVKAEMKGDCEVVFVDEGLVGGREFFGENSKKKISDEWVRCKRIWKDLWRTLDDSEIKIVHSNIPAVPGGMLRELVCAFIAKIRRRKFVIHFHSTVSSSVDSSLTAFLLKRICAAADAVVVLNEKSRSYVSYATRTPIILIPNFVSSAELNENRIVRDVVNTAIYVGGVCEEKGIYDFLAVARLFPDVRFVAIGKVEEGVKESAPSNVDLTGPMDHELVKREMDKADLFFFLSHYQHEGFSVALTEAMAAGLPCIVTDWAANADMIGNEGGAVISPGDIEAAKKAVLDLWGTEARVAASTANVEKVKSNYLSATVLDSMTEMYKRLLDGRLG